MDRTLLHQAWRLADESFRPSAVLADQAAINGPVQQNIQMLAQSGFFGLGISRAYDGLEADEVTRHEYTEILASACGVTAFTQQQLQIAISFVGRADNESLKGTLLPRLAQGEVFCGIALSQLRRSGMPMVRAERVTNGYRINGIIPWITGWDLLSSFVLGAVRLPTGEFLFALVDIAQNANTLQVSDPLPLTVMNASGTVSVTICDLFIPDSSVLNICSPDEFARLDDLSITSHTALPLGCARASVSYLRAHAEQQKRESLGQFAMALSFEIDQCRREALTWNCDCIDHPEYKTHALRARASAIVLAMRAAHATIAATGGGAHLRNATPQRLMREAQFYTTIGQTIELQETTLDQLISPFFSL